MGEERKREQVKEGKGQLGGKKDKGGKNEMCVLPSAYCSKRNTVSSETMNFFSCTMWGTE